MNREIQQRLQWVKMYEGCGDAGLVCRRCGISIPTLRKWVKQRGISGLESQIKRPHSSPGAKLTDELRVLILEMREKRNLGARRLQTELIRLHQVHLGTATLHKVLYKASVKPIVTYRRKKISTDTSAQSLVIESRWKPVKQRLEIISIQLSMIAPAIVF